MASAVLLDPGRGAPSSAEFTADRSESSSWTSSRIVVKTSSSIVVLVGIPVVVPDVVQLPDPVAVLMLGVCVADTTVAVVLEAATSVAVLEDLAGEIDVNVTVVVLVMVTSSTRWPWLMSRTKLLAVLEAAAAVVVVVVVTALVVVVVVLKCPRGLALATITSVDTSASGERRG